MPGKLPPGNLLTETVPTGVQSVNPVKAGVDPVRGWHKWMHQLGYQMPRRMDAVRKARESLLDSVRL